MFYYFDVERSLIGDEIVNDMSTYCYSTAVGPEQVCILFLPASSGENSGSVNKSGKCADLVDLETII